MESAIELLVGLTVGCLIAGLIHAVILRAAAKWVEKLDLGFGSAYVTALYVLLANAVLAVGLGWALPDSVSEDEIDVLSILLVPVSFLIQAWIVGVRLRIPFRRGCLVSLAMFGVALALAAVIGLILFLLVTVFG